jgi:MarR family transcriptional regulator, 2-MHQ and catechol-resistance regulon repressor
MTARAHPRADSTIEERLADRRLTAVGLLLEAAGGLSAKLAVQAAQFGLAPAEFEVLLRLARTPGQAMRMTDLAAQTLLTTSGITRVVDRLERDRLVERRACPTDRRGAFAAITAEGLDRLDRALPAHLDLIERWLISRLSAGDLETLLLHLRTIRDGIRPDATAGA